MELTHGIGALRESPEAPGRPVELRPERHRVSYYALFRDLTRVETLSAGSVIETLNYLTFLNEVTNFR